MILSDFHTHTTFSDGKYTPSEMAKAAYGKGLAVFGISDHSYTYFDDSYCLPLARYGEYIHEVCRLKKEYEGKMKILVGIEQDMYSAAPTECFDYVIGSAHYLDFGGRLLAIDESKEALIENCRKYYGGDFIKLAEVYYSQFADFIVRTRPQIVGHFDYIARDNGDGSLFDESDPRYVNAWQNAAKRILSVCSLFEINTGCISRGYRKGPYPRDAMIRFISEHGGKFILSSDAHNCDNICFEFERWEKEYEKFI